MINLSENQKAKYDFVISNPNKTKKEKFITVKKYADKYGVEFSVAMHKVGFYLSVQDNAEQDKIKNPKKAVVKKKEASTKKTKKPKARNKK